MNPEQQRIAIAEACGWKNADHPDVMKLKHGWVMPEKWCMNPNGELRFNHDRPDYLNDLNAMRGASDTLNDNQQWQFIQHLNEITRNKDHSDAEDWFIQNTDWTWRMIHATAAQRAEAFLRTIGKWEEAK